MEFQLCKNVSNGIYIYKSMYTCTYLNITQHSIYDDNTYTIYATHYYNNNKINQKNIILLINNSINIPYTEKKKEK